MPFSYTNAYSFMGCVAIYNTQIKQKYFRSPWVHFGKVLVRTFTTFLPFCEIAFGRVQAALKRGGKANKCARAKILRRIPPQNQTLRSYELGETFKTPLSTAATFK